MIIIIISKTVVRTLEEVLFVRAVEVSLVVEQRKEHGLLLVFAIVSRIVPILGRHKDTLHGRSVRGHAEQLREKETKLRLESFETLRNTWTS